MLPTWQNVNAYIRDAEESAQANPNDEEAQQIVMDAYEQRATDLRDGFGPFPALVGNARRQMVWQVQYGSS